MRLVNKSLRKPLEQAVSDYRGRAWRVRRVRDLSEFACHPYAILSSGSFAVFAKYSEAPEAQERFGTERVSLQLVILLSISWAGEHEMVEVIA